MSQPTNPKITASTAASREAVPVEVYERVDFDALNKKVAEYRELLREGGVEAAGAEKSFQSFIR